MRCIIYSPEERAVAIRLLRKDCRCLYFSEELWDSGRVASFINFMEVIMILSFALSGRIATFTLFVRVAIFILSGSTTIGTLEESQPFALCGRISTISIFRKVRSLSFPPFRKYRYWHFWMSCGPFSLSRKPFRMNCGSLSRQCIPPTTHHLLLNTLLWPFSWEIGES